MLFDVPEMIGNIPDIKQIYEINEKQEKALDDSVSALWDDVFLYSMGIEKTRRWEEMLGLVPLDTDTLDERRFRVQTKVLERMPYTYRVVLRKLETLCSAGLTWSVDADAENVVVKVALGSKNMREDVEELLENILPLNMVYSVIILYNTYERIGSHTYEELATFTQQQMRDDTAIGGA